MKRIGDILCRYKEAEIVKDDVTYKQVTIGTNYKGVRLRGTKAGSEIGTKNQWLVKAGQFILSRIDARNSAFGIIPDDLNGALVTNDFMAYDVNEDMVDRDFFNVFLQSPQFLEACIKASRGNTNRKRVQEDFFLSYEVDLPEIDHQRLLIQKIKHAKAAMAKIEVEISKQISLLANLKQAILHEAIQGKLTADWRAANRDTEPASKLLERIKEEKARLIAEKKIKKEKPLPEITPEETPFAIPEGWEWCRLGNINLEYNGGAAFKSNHILAEGRNQVVRIGNIKPDKLDLTKRPAFISEDLAQGSVTSELYPGDLLITMTGTYEKKDYCYSVLLKNGHFEDKRLFQNQRVGCFRLSQKIEKDFIKTAIKNEQLLDPVFKSSTGAANQANISKGALHNILIPLPPLKEQQAIVERVDALMETCRKLEDEIEQSSDHAADLLQAVLKEAFASAS